MAYRITFYSSKNIQHVRHGVCYSTLVKLMNMPASFTRKYLLIFILALCSQQLFATGKVDTLKQKVSLSMNIDSLKKQLVYSSDSLKGQIYTRIAMQYMKFDTISD